MVIKSETEEEWSGIYERRECLVGEKNLKEKEKTMNENSIFSSLALKKNFQQNI